MNYKTYAEAKIANPDCEIVTTSKDWGGDAGLIGVFEALVLDGTDDEGGAHEISDTSWVICNPADYCSTLKEFLGAGLRLVDGDHLINMFGNVGVAAGVDDDNVPDDHDHKRYILSSAALNGGCKIPYVEPWTIYNNTLPLSELSDEQAAQLFNSWRKVGEDKDMQWRLEVAYRIKPKSERDLFIAASVQIMTSETERTMEQMFGAQFDAGARYKDLTQFFGENI